MPVAVLQLSWDHAVSALLSAFLLSSTFPVCLVPAQLLLPAAHTRAMPREDKMGLWHWRKEVMNGDLGLEGTSVCCLCTGM